MNWPSSPVAPTCWENHKFRNCQNLDEDGFEVGPRSLVVRCGESATIQVGNNTPATKPS